MTAKLLVLKLMALVVALTGALLLGIWAQAPEAGQVLGYLEQARDWIAARAPLSIVAGGVLLILGLYGFLPRFPERGSRRYITFSSGHGDVRIQLMPLQKTLAKVMRNMPEIRSVRLDVRPDKSKQRARIKAQVVLNNQPEINARQTATTVTRYIAETAVKMLGLEDLATIDLQIADIHLDSKEASKAIREGRARQTAAPAAAAATDVPEPAAPGVPMAGPGTGSVTETPPAQPPARTEEEQMLGPPIVSDFDTEGEDAADVAWKRQEDDESDMPEPDIEHLAEDRQAYREAPEPPMAPLAEEEEPDTSFSALIEEERGRAEASEVQPEDLTPDDVRQEPGAPPSAEDEEKHDDERST